MNALDVDRTRAKERAWGTIARRFDAMAYRARVRAWLAHSALGATDRAGVTVTARTLGHLTATLPDGTACEMDAPIPLA
ncbi:MAG: hypothetical protein K0S37_805 [Microbacterium sp.]|jgi:hypothetical protein|nr:hypothetical protein [Microbacterium sp.]